MSLAQEPSRGEPPRLGELFSGKSLAATAATVAVAAAAVAVAVTATAVATTAGAVTAGEQAAFVAMAASVAASGGTRSGAGSADSDLFLDLFFNPGAFLDLAGFLLGYIGADLESLGLFLFDILADLDIDLLNLVLVAANVDHDLLEFGAIGGHGNLAGAGFVLIDPTAGGHGNLAGFANSLVAGATAAIATGLYPMAGDLVTHAGFGHGAGNAHVVRAGFHLGFGNAVVDRAFFLLHDRNANGALTSLGHHRGDLYLILASLFLPFWNLNSDFDILFDPLGGATDDFDFLPHGGRSGSGYGSTAGASAIGSGGTGAITAIVTLLMTTHGPSRGAGQTHAYEGDDRYDQTLHQMSPQ